MSVDEKARILAAHPNLLTCINEKNINERLALMSNGSSENITPKLYKYLRAHVARSNRLRFLTMVELISEVYNLTFKAKAEEVANDDSKVEEDKASTSEEPQNEMVQKESENVVTQEPIGTVAPTDERGDTQPDLQQGINLQLNSQQNTLMDIMSRAAKVVDAKTPEPGQGKDSQTRRNTMEDNKATMQENSVMGVFNDAVGAANTAGADPLQNPEGNVTSNVTTLDAKVMDELSESVKASKEQRASNAKSTGIVATIGVKLPASERLVDETSKIGMLYNPARVDAKGISAKTVEAQIKDKLSALVKNFTMQKVADYNAWLALSENQQYSGIPNAAEREKAKKIVAMYNAVLSPAVGEDGKPIPTEDVNVIINKKAAASLQHGFKLNDGKLLNKARMIAFLLTEVNGSLFAVGAVDATGKVDTKAGGIKVNTAKVKKQGATGAASETKSPTIVIQAINRNELGVEYIYKDVDVDATEYAMFPVDNGEGKALTIETYSFNDKHELNKYDANHKKFPGQAKKRKITIKAYVPVRKLKTEISTELGGELTSKTDVEKAKYLAFTLPQKEITDVNSSTVIEKLLGNEDLMKDSTILVGALQGSGDNAMLDVIKKYTQAQTDEAIKSASAAI